MTLGEIIAALKQEPKDKILSIGFGRPHSYRGYCHDLAFEVVFRVSVADVLDACESAIGREFDGWKGGTYLMDEQSDCWLAEEGSSVNSTAISPLLLAYMLGKPMTELRAIAVRDLGAKPETEPV